MKRVLKVLAFVLLATTVAGAVFYLHPLWVVDQMTHYRLWRAGVKSEYADVDGHWIHYFETSPGDGGGRPLVLVHGLGDRGESWAAMMPRLAAAGFHVYAPDLLGYGRSARPPDADYSIPLEEKVVADFMGTIHVAKASVVGWSMGGWIAMRLAADRPLLVDRLVLYDSAGVYFETSFPNDLFTPHDSAGLARLIAVLSPNPKPMPAFVARDALRKLQRGSLSVTRSMASMRDGRSLMDFRLGEIHQPTLIVWGGHDDLLPLSTGERLHQGISQSKLVVVDGCGHLAPVECPVPVLNATLAFLAAELAPEKQARHEAP